MTIEIKYKSNPPQKSNFNNVFFVDQQFNISNLKKYINSSEFSFISDLIKSKNQKKKVINFDINSKKKNNISFLKKKISLDLKQKN